MTQQTAFDPRFSIIFRPTGSDLVRLSTGVANGDPAPQLRFAPTAITATPASLNPRCDNLTVVGSTPNANLGPERTTDYELAYGHRFHEETALHFDAYYSSQTNTIFGGVLPITSVGTVVIDPNTLAQIYARIASQCSAQIPNPSLANLGVSTFFNAASGTAKGFDIGGRIRLRQRLYVDYGYGVQSIVRNGISDTVLQTNAKLINGSQLPNVPLQKANLALGYDGPRQLSLRIDGTYVGNNNSYNRPAFSYADMSISKGFGRTEINLGISNLFNNDSDNYGRFGYGVFVPENQFGTDRNSFDQATERFSLPARSVMFTVTQRL